MQRSFNKVRWWSIGGFLTAFVLAVLVGPSWAVAPDVTRVEEDWELVIGTPSITADAPQVTSVIAPFGAAGSVYATFTVNHYDTPVFTAGGLQLQVWNGKTLLASQRHPNQAVMSTPDETIRWTQVTKLTPEGLVFEVIGGHSTTWGAFGGDGTLKATIPTTAQNLNAYNPDVSAERSGVSFAGNRVWSLVLKGVRTYGATGLIAEDTSPRVVHSLD